MVLNTLGYDIYRVRRRGDERRSAAARHPLPPAADAIWPLPRSDAGWTDQKIRDEFRRFEFWHYKYEFEGGLHFPVRHSTPSEVADAPERHLQRYRHFMPYLLQANNGTLKGKRILDIACNSGFWSIQCALLGAEVLGFDARPELVEQARLIKSIVGTEQVEFRTLDFWDMDPESLGGKFDIVLNLGVLYQLPDPLQALGLTKSMARDMILLDTCLYPIESPFIRLDWQEPVDIRSNVTPGIITCPTRKAVELMLRHIGVASVFEIPVRTTDMPVDYLKQRRASWIIRV